MDQLMQDNDFRENIDEVYQKLCLEEKKSSAQHQIKLPRETSGIQTNN